MADYDVVVAGAGLIGASAALGLAQLGQRVAVIEPAPPVIHPGASGFEARTVAINPAAQQLLQQLGVWPALSAYPFRSIRVWEELGTRSISFCAAEVDRDELGWIAEVGRASVAFWNALQDEQGVEVLDGQRLTGIEASAQSLRLRSEDAAFSASLLVGADGARSQVRQMLGASVRHLATPHAAIATVVRTQHDSAGVAYQRFLRDGPLALLPLPPLQEGDETGVCSVIWSQSRDQAHRRMELDDRSFCAELEAASEAVLGAVRASDQRFCFDLDQLLVGSFQPAPRVALVGDAGRVLHPLAGQGANLGFEDVVDLLAVAGRVLGADSAGDLGGSGLWRGYARRRRAKGALLVKLMDVFRVGYALEDPLMRLLRNVGVDALDRSRALKRRLISEALGLGVLS